MALLDDIREHVIDGEMDEVVEGVQQAIEEGLEVSDILNQALIDGMSEVGELFESGEFFVPEMLIAARAMKKGLEVLRPKLLEADIQPLGKMIIGTVKGDLHDIGKNLVATMIEGAGFEIIDLGTDIPAEQFVEALNEHKPELLGLSALLTTTMPAMAATVQAINDAGIRKHVTIFVGGAPVTQEFAQQIGADYYAADGSAAAKIAKKVVG